jgi:pimeloyl-ACP methyl ester carboxylesterase
MAPPTVAASSPAASDTAPCSPASIGGRGRVGYDLGKRLAQGPVIAVPTITLEGDANGAPHPDPSSYAGKFSGEYVHRTIEGGVGHNLPQEAPDAFADAVLDVGGRGR